MFDSLAAIHAAIPHRPPFLFVDEIVSQEERRIVCRKTFRPDEYFYAGHYPGFAVTPGVVLCEAGMQAGAILLAPLMPREGGRVPVATRMNDVKFKRMVRPGETIEMDVELTERVRDAFFLTAKVTCGGQVAVRFEFACTLAATETTAAEVGRETGGRGSRRAAGEGEAPAEPQGRARLPPSRESPADMPSRKHPAHGVVESEQVPTIVFLTVCTKDRGKWLACEDVAALLRETWTNATAWRVGRYVVMPDHIHLFAAPGTPEIELDPWVSYWKSQFSKQHQNERHRWQTDHWDSRIRNWESYAEKWEYVRYNPVRKGLVTKPEDWPFQGEIYPLY